MSYNSVQSRLEKLLAPVSSLLILKCPRLFFGTRIQASEVCLADKQEDATRCYGV